MWRHVHSWRSLECRWSIALFRHMAVPVYSVYQSLFLIRQYFFFFSYALPLFTTLGSSSNVVSEWSGRPPMASGSPFVLAWPQSSFRARCYRKIRMNFLANPIHPTMKIPLRNVACNMQMAVTTSWFLERRVLNLGWTPFEFIWLVFCSEKRNSMYLFF